MFLTVLLRNFRAMGYWLMEFGILEITSNYSAVALDSRSKNSESYSNFYPAALSLTYTSTKSHEIRTKRSAMYCLQQYTRLELTVASVSSTTVSIQLSNF